MPTFTDFAFQDGDLVPIEIAPGVFDLATVSDNEALEQDCLLNLNLQIGFNQYFPDDGWDVLGTLKGDLTPDTITKIASQVKRVVERVDFVKAATCTFLGSNRVGSGQTELVFQITADTTLGPLVLPFVLGGGSNV